MTDTADLFIVGGGINGVGIARDAALRGLKVILAERDDLGGHTSSASSKLIHGGLRYLENYDFKLVRESLIERELLMHLAPHLIHARRFVLPHHSGLRPAFILRLGLFLYDHLGGRKLLPATRTLNLRKTQTPLKNSFKKGFEYSDCWVDDARLVILSALDAEAHGARILKGHEVTRADHGDGLWQVSVRTPDGGTVHYKARALVNAAGPWVNEFRAHMGPAQEIRRKVRLVKGSHIIVPALYDGPEAYTLQNGDGRVVFVIPYEGRHSLIGTTDVPYMGDPSNPQISKDEIIYLCEAVSDYFRQPVSPGDVVWSYAGIRPLVDDGHKNASKTTRDYVLDLIAEHDAPPLLNIYGGKITTYRHLGEEAVDILAPYLGCTAKSASARHKLPGGDIPNDDFPAFVATVQARYPWLPADIAARLADAYGTRVDDLLMGITILDGMGRAFGAGLYAAEITYLRRTEWATTAEDILWRRTKRGLHMTADERASVTAYMANQI